MSSISFSLVSCIVFLPHFFCILHPLMPHCTVSCLLCTSLRFCLLVCFPVIRLVPVLFSLHTCHSYFLTAPSGPLPCYHSVYSCLLIYCFLAYPSPCLPSLLLAVVFCCMAPRPICFQASHCPCAFVCWASRVNITFILFLFLKTSSPITGQFLALDMGCFHGHSVICVWELLLLPSLGWEVRVLPLYRISCERRELYLCPSPVLFTVLSPPLPLIALATQFLTCINVFTICYIFYEPK